MGHDWKIKDDELILMKFNIKIKGKNYNIEIFEGPGKTVVGVNGSRFSFGKKASDDSMAQSSSSSSSKKEISSSLAGTISEVFVKEGDEVKKGQKLLSLLAMKMENEIVSESDGKVKQVLVVKDQKVKEGETLIILI